MPDIVTVLDFEELIEMNEDELHDQVKQINKIREKGET